MSTSNSNTQNPANPGVSKPISFGSVSVPNPTSAAPISQIRGVSAKGSTGAGVPKHVANVSASVASASVGTTSAITVTFRRDSSDPTFSGVNVFVKGYQGNQAAVQIGGGSESPVTFVLNNTGEAINVVVQSTGNTGSAPLSTAPSTGIKLPKSSNGGFGTTTVVSPPPTPPTQTILDKGYFWSHSSLVQDAGASTATAVSLTLGNSGATDAANRVICFQMILKITTTVRKISYCESTLGTGKTSCAIYDSTGNTKLLDAGANAFDTNTSGFQAISLGAAVTLQPGVYWFACSATATAKTAAVGATLSAGVASPGAGFNKNSTKMGLAANAMSSGAMPSSLGAITAFSTAAGTNSCPGFFFEG